MSDVIIQIKDYQGIEVAKMRVREGLTAVIGKTNAGKSSIMRALEDLLENGCGDSDVRIGAEQASIAMKNNDNVVKLIRNPNKPIKTQYIVNGEEIEKVGRNKIDETDILGIIPTGEYNLNFIKQEDLPFLIYENGYRLYEFISQSKSQVLLDAVENLTSEKKDLEKAIKVTDAEINEIKNRYQDIVDELKGYPSISAMYQLNKQVDELSLFIEKADMLKNDYNGNLKQIRLIDKELQEVNNLVNNLEKINLNKIESIIRDNSRLVDLKNNYEETKRKYEENNISIKSVDETLFNLNVDDIIDIINLISNCNKLKNEYYICKNKIIDIDKKLQNYPNIEFNVDISMINIIKDSTKLKNEYNKYITQVEDIDEKIKSLNSDIEKYSKYLDENKICPTCGQLIKDCKEKD